MAPVLRRLIEDPGDRRLDGFRSLREPARRRQIDRDHRVFVAEGIGVLRALLASPYRVRAVLVATARADAVAALMDGVDAPLLVAAPEILLQVAGFAVHRGVVALGERRPLPDPFDLALAARLMLLVEGVTDHENLGALYRNAAAFDVDAVILDPTVADPLYRRSLRVSMGHVLHVDTARMTQWPSALDELSNAGWSLLALTPDPDAEPVESVVEDLRSSGGLDRVALMVGAEGPGLSAAALAAADRRVRIPMSARVDSINVATAAGIALHRISGASRTDRTGGVGGDGQG